MLTILADMLFTASRQNGPDSYPDHPKDYADRYVRRPRANRAEGVSRHKFNPYSDLWW